MTAGVVRTQGTGVNMTAASFPGLRGFTEARAGTALAFPLLVRPNESDDEPSERAHRESNEFASGSPLRRGQPDFHPAECLRRQSRSWSFLGR